MEHDPEAMAELRALGLRTLPVTVIGETVVVGFNRSELVRALELSPESDRTRPGADVLLERYERVLGAFLRANRQIPDASLDWKSPERERTLRGFVYHVYDRPDLVLRGTQSGAYRYEDIRASFETAEAFRTTDSLVRHGEAVLERLRQYLGRAADADLECPIDSYQGVLTVRELLDLALGHAAHHLKQLYHYFGLLGITADSPLTADDLTGIDLPSQLF
ncbi:MAG: DinB family protein [Gemmatimonadetes bacterium]|nr:DinB family protein [Gemmatimonadota bacterium]